MKLRFIGADHEVTGSLHYVEAAGLRILVDCGMEQGRNYYENAPLPIKYSEVDYILLTHAHFDHMLSAKAFLDEGARLYVGAADVPALTDETLNLCGMIGTQLKIDARPVALREGDSVREAGLSLSVLETPGHTPGGVCYHVRNAGVLFSGDTLFEGGYGRVDFPGGSAQALRRSLHRLCTELASDTRVLCGHGGETTIARERRMGY